MVYRKLLLSFGISAGLLLSATVARPQDTLTLSIDQAKALLLKENLTILANHYNIDIAEAEALQAKAWNNPHFNWNQDMYSLERNQYFNFANQFLIQVDQVFSIAGKYTNTVKLANINVEMNRLMLQDVIRGLMMALGEEFNLLYALQQKQSIYNEVLEKYKKIIAAGEKQLEVGAIAANEVVRLKSEQIAIETEALNNRNEVSSTMGQLRILLNLKPTVTIKIIESKLPSVEPVLNDLFSAGMENRPDMKLAKTTVSYHEQNLKLQKSNAFPDILVGYQPKDKGSNYVRPYQGLVVEFDLPLFNRNSGDIKAAKTGIKKAQVEMSQQENILLNEITSAYLNLVNTRECLQNYNESFLQSIEQLNHNANLNFNKKNLSLLEYIDLQRIYVQNKMQYIDLKNQYFLSVNRLNFSVGKEVVN